MSMDKKKEIIRLLDELPNYKIGYVLAYIQGLMIVDEIEPDEWDLQMIAEAEANNDGESISIEEVRKTLKN